MITKENLSGRAKLSILGDVVQVLNGTVDPAQVHQRDLSKVAYGLGAGRYSHPSFFGETIVLNHIAWGMTLNANNEWDTEKARESLDTPFLMGIEIKTQPSSLVSFENLAAIEIIEELASQVSLGYAFLADAQFAVFEGSYLKRSPIYGENINELHQKYWEFPGALMEAQAFLFGVVLTAKGKQTLTEVKKGFYHNPNEKTTSALSAHTHAALCEQHPLARSFADMQELCLTTSLLGVRHFLTQSLVKKGVFALFELVS